MTISAEEFHSLIRAGLAADGGTRAPVPGRNLGTPWFRDAPVWSVLRTSVLPELVAARAPHRQLALWSAACSTGPEVYSLALLLADRFPQLSRWTVRLIGSDRDDEALEQARQACYTEPELQGLTATGTRTRHFAQVGPLWRASSELRRQVDLKRIDLTGMWPSLPVFDVVLLRGVLLQYDVPVRRRILDRLHRSMASDGYLVLGAVEHLVGVSDRWAPEVRDGVLLFRPVAA